MKRSAVLSLMASIPLLAGTQLPTTPVSNAVNVNARYAIESIEVGLQGDLTLSDDLQLSIKRLIGQKFDEAQLDSIGERIKKEVHARSVTRHVRTGTQPDNLQVFFEVRPKTAELNVDLSRFLYHSKQNWTGALFSNCSVGPSKFTVGLLSDNDELAERNAGLILGYTHRKIGTERIQLRFQYETYHQQWNEQARAAGGQMLLASGDSPLYRARDSYEPMLSIELAGPLIWTTGFSFQRVQYQFPAARIETSNSVINTLRYRRQWEGSDAKHVVDAGYALRAATKILKGDFVYARHSLHAGYAFRRRKHEVGVNFTAGRLTGRAPIFERYVLGTSSTLRGWSKYDVAPLGGDRMAHNSLEYRYGVFQIFYDTGAVWSRGSGFAVESPKVRHGGGIALRLPEHFTVAVAFPLKEGRMEPIFMAGMNF